VLWGDEHQQSTYLPSFTGENVPAAALAVLENRPLFDPFSLRTKATRTASGFTLTGEKSLVPRSPGLTLVRLEHKLGIRASDTAHYRLEDVRVPKDNLLGSPEVDVDKGFAGVMQTFDNTRPLVAAMAVGVARAALEETLRLLTEAGVEINYDKPVNSQSAAAAAYIQMEADWEAGYLLTLK
jgi:alkylation response protein AidB-like acyl-CoA dehydrogenase